MGRQIARIGDRVQGLCSHPSHDKPIVTGGTIITGSPDVSCGGRGVARMGDSVLTDCGHTAVIITAAGNLTANSRPTARSGDLVRGDFDGNIISGYEKSIY